MRKLNIRHAQQIGQLVQADLDSIFAQVTMCRLAFLAVPTALQINAGFFYSMRNMAPCADITDIKIDIRKDPNSDSWEICSPLKNWGDDCYDQVWSFTSPGLIGGAGTAGTCYSWPFGDSCEEYHIEFNNPGGTPGCTSDNTWDIPYTDEFSFVLCGADDGTSCPDDSDGGTMWGNHGAGDIVGIDIYIQWTWTDGTGTHNIWRKYENVGASDVCNGCNLR